MKFTPKEDCRTNQPKCHDINKNGSVGFPVTTCVDSDMIENGDQRKISTKSQ